MSIMRVLVMETSQSRAKMMKHFRDGEHVYKNAKKDGILNSYTLVETNDRWLVITEFDTKAKMNKFVKALSAVRRDVEAETGQQSWIYSGQVKASG